jgi:hypothetical protein
VRGNGEVLLDQRDCSGFVPGGGSRSALDAAPGGRILVLVEQGVSPPITLVLNWDAN